MPTVGGRSQAFREANLCGHNDRLSCPVATTDHHLLGQEHLLHRYLNAQVPSGHHDAITGSQDVIKVLHSFFIFNLVADDTKTEVGSVNTYVHILLHTHT